MISIPPVIEDRDGDGVPDYLDGFPDDPAAGRDTDGDGLPDTCDASAVRTRVHGRSRR